MDDTWVVVADGHRARIFKTDAEMLELVLVKEMKNKQHAAAHRSGDGNHDSAHDDEENRFAREVAHDLDQAQNGHLFRTVVLVAPPRFLGFLRGHLSAATTRRIGGTVAKDLAAEEVHALATHVRKLLANNHIEDAR